MVSSVSISLLPGFSSVSVFANESSVRACVRAISLLRTWIRLTVRVCGCDMIWYAALLWDTETIFRSAVVFRSIRGTLRSSGAGMMEREEGRKEEWKEERMEGRKKEGRMLRWPG